MLYTHVLYLGLFLVVQKELIGRVSSFPGSPATFTLPSTSLISPESFHSSFETREEEEEASLRLIHSNQVHRHHLPHDLHHHHNSLQDQHHLSQDFVVSPATRVSFTPVFHTGHINHQHQSFVPGFAATFRSAPVSPSQSLQPNFIPGPGDLSVSTSAHHPVRHPVHETVSNNRSSSASPSVPQSYLPGSFDPNLFEYVDEEPIPDSEENNGLIIPPALVQEDQNSINPFSRFPPLSSRTAPDTSATVWTSLKGNVVRMFTPVRISSRFNQGCVGGTKCQFFLVCWMSGGSLGSSCGPLYTCCVTPSSQEIQPAFYGPVVNDPYCGRSSTRISRIVGGSDASFGQFPWQAFVQVGGSRCGGALVGPRHVVTAGHCVARSQHNPTSIRVTLGDYILHSDIESLPHEVFTVAEVRLHPNFRFTPQADRFDVAVLILDRNAHYQDNIKPICLPTKDASFLGRTSYVAGWGALQAGSKLRPKVLQHVAVPVIENAICETWHRKRGINIRIHDEMMCAGYEFGGRDACQGDSGGPLMLNDYGVWYLIGIVSAGYSCAKQYQPGIYHRVSSSSDWISANVQSSTRR